MSGQIIIKFTNLNSSAITGDDFPIKKPMGFPGFARDVSS